MTYTRIHLLATAAALACGMASPAEAAAQIRRFDVPAQPASAAALTGIRSRATGERGAEDGARGRGARGSRGRHRGGLGP